MGVEWLDWGRCGPSRIGTSIVAKSWNAAHQKSRISQSGEATPVSAFPSRQVVGPAAQLIAEILDQLHDVPVRVLETDNALRPDHRIVAEKKNLACGPR